MLIPSMRGSLGFNYVEIGFLSGSIMLGYLLFSLITGMLATRFGPKRIIVTSLLCGAFSMFSIGRLSGFLPLLVSTFAMGAAGAGAHISMTTLPMAWFGERKLGRALGITTGGTGFGIVVTGLVLPYLLMNLGTEAWRQCWLLLASLTFLVAIIGWMLLKDKPDKTGMPIFSPAQDGGLAPSTGRRNGLPLKAIVIVYFIFGFAYNIYATYFVAYMVEGIRLPQKTAGDIWAIFGWMCMGSGLLWGFVSDRLGRREALIWNNGIIALSVLLALLVHEPFFLGISAFLFGATFLGTVTVIAAVIGDQIVRKKAFFYGLVTLIHGAGQFLGTIFGGYLRNLTGSFQSSLAASLLGFLLCLAITILMRKARNTISSAISR
jgi:MFS family permease